LPELLLAVTRSSVPSAFRSPATTLIGKLPNVATGDCGAGLKLPFPLPSKMVTSFEETLETARSGFPSLLKSPLVTPAGLVPAGAGDPGAALKPPFPFPNMIETLLVVKLATAKSCLPSLLKSDTTKPETNEPAGTVSVDMVKPPTPSPIRIATFDEAPAE